MPDIKLLITRHSFQRHHFNKYILANEFGKAQLALLSSFLFRKLCVTLMTDVLGDLTFPFSHFIPLCILNYLNRKVATHIKPKHPTIHLNEIEQVCTLSLSPYLWPYCVWPQRHAPLQDLSEQILFFKAPTRVCLQYNKESHKACPVITLSLFLSVQPVLPGWVPTGS